MSNKVFKYLYFTIVILIIIAGVYPPIKWQLEPYKDINMYILDKTVADNSYREHRGLMWVLNANKYTLGGDKPFDYAADYYGIYPTADHQYSIKSLPSNLNNADLIYIADTYGVYTDEKEELNSEAEQVVFQNGGITKDDISSIKKALYDDHTTLVAEFNTFGSPSGQSEKEEMYDLMGFRWSGWIGRYFVDLEADFEIPDWAVENYEKQYGTSWAFDGEGYIFVKTDGSIVVLESKKDVKASGLKIHFNRRQKAYFGVEEDVYYSYWFDIIEPYEQTDILATYKLKLTDEGMKKFEQISNTTEFPAVVKYKTDKYTSYYFAGDFSDMSQVTAFYKFYGLDWIKKIFAFDTRSNDVPFFWKVYVPMMKTILAEVSGEKGAYEDYVIEYEEGDSYKYNTRVNEQYFEVFKNGKWDAIKISGVNIGMGKPGFYPGEAKITREEYLRWFKQIKDMGANAIRVYTINPPDFYNALYEFNRNTDTPLYVFHGLWVDEESFLSVEDIDDEAFISQIKTEINNTIDLIHGDANIRPKQGHASGKYSYDISEYIVGWIYGIEWDSSVVQLVDEKGGANSSVNLNYLKTVDAKPFENWLARMMDYTLSYEINKYGWSRPISFTNWPTTDILEHPSEPFEFEDMVEIDPNVIQSNSKNSTGVFASYHIYPNYPDFMNLDAGYQAFAIDEHSSSYEAYLKELIATHNLPVLVAEFGVPSSRGIGRNNPDGFDQGHNTEVEQGRKNAELYHAIIDQGYAGGILFSWQDEWFKKSWNLEQFDNPEKRAYWFNAQTYEEQYGLLAFDSSLEDIFSLGGAVDDWRKIEPLIDDKDTFSSGLGTVDSLQVVSDEKYLYMKIDIEGMRDKSFWNEHEAMIAFDVIPNQGNELLKSEGIALNEGTDFILRIKGEEATRMYIDPYYDPLGYLYGDQYKVFEAFQRPEENSGQFSPIFMIQNAKTIIPDTGEILPSQRFETGHFIHGSDNKEADDYNTLADFKINYDNESVVLQIPWMLLNAKDPSEKEFLSDLWEYNLEGSQFIDGIYLSVMTIDSSKQEVVDFGPVRGRDMGEVLYTWDNWDLPGYTERLKDSYEIMKETFMEVQSGK